MGKRKVSSRKRKKVEYRPTEGDPRNTQASFRLQDFKMWKFSTFSELAFYVLLLLALPPAMNSNETPTPTDCSHRFPPLGYAATLHASSPTSSTASLGQCAVCLDKDCATRVRIIYPAGGVIAVWARANSPTGIQNCSMENLKADAPCKMANGSLVQLANEMLHFEEMNPRGVRRAFHSQILPCADLINSKPSPGMCAGCLDKDCATGVSEIYPASSDAAVWVKANSRTGIQNCSMENLKADAPCKMANGNLVQLTDKTLRFEGINPPDKRRIFHSQSLPCAVLINSKPSPVTKAPNIPEAENKGFIIGIIIGSIGGIGIGGIVFSVCIGVLLWNHGQGQDRDHHHGNNKVPPDAEDRDESCIQIQPPNAEVPNRNVNGVH